MAIYDPESNQHSDGSDSIAIFPVYYKVHVFHSKDNTYSILVKIISDKILTNNDIIQYCIDTDLFLRENDKTKVDYITEIEKDEYEIGKDEYNDMYY